MTIFKPEIGPGFFDDLGSEDMSVLKAFNELIANSIDSWIQKGKTKTSRGQLTINIIQQDNALIITDNADGMNKQDMINAMGFGVAQKSSSDFGDDLMGTYGFGLKASTSALGSHFEVISKMSNKKIVHSVMPIGKMKDEQSWQCDIEEKINPKSLVDEKYIKSFIKLGKADSGTMIYISDLRNNLEVQFLNQGYLINELGIAWQFFISENDFGKPVKIFLNNEQVKTPEKGYDQGGQIANTQIDFEFPVYFETKKGNKTVDHEEWVSGSIWVNNVGGQVDAGGFNVYRKGQLVQRHDNTIFRVLAENARVEGELHLDFVPANQRKTYFNKEHPGFKEVERFLKTFVPNKAVHSSTLNRAVLADTVLLNNWIVDKWYGHFITIIEDLELPNELKRFKKANPEPPSSPSPPGGPIPPKPPEGPSSPTPPKDDIFVPLSDESFEFEGVQYSIIYIKGNCAGNVYAYKVDKNRIQINVDDSIDGVKPAFQKDLLKIVKGPVRSGYQKIAKDLITQSVIQQFLTRTLGPNEALKQSQKWLKFVNKK